MWLEDGTVKQQIQVLECATPRKPAYWCNILVYCSDGVFAKTCVFQCSLLLRSIYGWLYWFC